MENTLTRGGSFIVANSVEILVIDGIVHVTYLDGAEITVEVKRQMHEAFMMVTEGRKMPFLFRSAGRLWITKEAREYARDIEKIQPFVACALVAETLGFRLMADFYGRIYKPVIPYKVCRTEQEAIGWLRSFEEGTGKAGK